MGIRVSGSHYLELVDLLNVGWVAGLALIVLSGYRPRKSGRAIAFMIVLVASWGLSLFISVRPRESLIYFGYYSFIVLPGLILLYATARDRRRLLRFCEGFLIGGVISACFGVAQALTGGYPRLVNNQEFNLLHAGNRAFGFCPEPSTLAGLLIIALSMLTVIRTAGRCDSSESWIFQTRHQVLIGMVLLAALAATRSSQVLAVFPPAIFVALMAAGGLKRAIKVFAIACLPLALMVGLFYEFSWKPRLEKSDANASSFMRISTIIAAGVAIREHWVSGVGIGVGNEVAMDRLRALAGRGALFERLGNRSGVTSFVLRSVLEQGILVVLIFGATLWWLAGPVFWPRDYLDRVHVSILSSFGSTAFALGLTSTGYRGLIHVWAFIAFAVAVRSLRFDPRAGFTGQTA